MRRHDEETDDVHRGVVSSADDESICNLHVIAGATL
jgi:hypothetical protein